MKNRAIPAKCRGPALCALLFAAGAAAQELPVILEVQVENAVSYNGDVTDPSKVARTPGPVPGLTAAELGNFWRAVGLGDVTAINGSPAMGLAITGLQALVTRVAPTPTQAIADVQRANLSQHAYEFLTPDGTSFATIYTISLFRAGATIGAIIGGTGVFQGARGSVTQVGVPRSASQAEDPSMRRINGGGQVRYVFQLFPMFRPEVLIGGNGPAVFHGDYSLVTTASPARAGETLIVYAKGLGPTSPSVNPGDPFPNGPFATATSPVEVLVNGKSAPAINQIGVPGTTDTYRVDFRVPDETVAGSANVQVSAAWVKGAAVSIPVQ